MIKLCIAGATGRMGSTIIREAVNRGFEIKGAIASGNSPKKGKTLRELGICDLDVSITSSLELEEVVEKADVYVSFTSPEAELSNIPVVANVGKRIVMGTTGFADDQMDQLKTIVRSKVPAVFAPNFAIGVNLLLRMMAALKALPRNYDISIIEAHHSGKKDAPSGTAQAIAKTASELRGYSRTVYGRSGISIRQPEEIEVFAVRGGGIPGIHRVLIVGDYDMLSIEHTVFSRSVFAQGALQAVKWIVKQDKPGVYSLDDLFSN